MTSKFHYQLVFVQHGEMPECTELLVMSEILCKGKFEGWMDDTYFTEKNENKKKNVFVVVYVYKWGPENVYDGECFTRLKLG